MGGIIGISAEVLSAIGEKIACGRESLKNYLRAVEIDPNDYYIYFSIARYHWEIYRLPSLMKWSANRISTTPFDSSTTDVLEWLKKAEEFFPYERPYSYIPADILTLKAQCLMETKLID